MKNKIPVIGKSPISELGAGHHGLVSSVTMDLPGGVDGRKLVKQTLHFSDALIVLKQGQ